MTSTTGSPPTDPSQPETAESGTKAPAPLGVERWRQLGIGLVLLVGATLSLTLAVLQTGLAPGLPNLIGKNTLELPRRLLTLRITFGVAAVTVLGVSIVSFVKKPMPAAQVLRWGKVASPLILSVFVPALFVRGPWGGQEATYLVILGIFGLVLEQLLTLSFDALGPVKVPFAQSPRRELILSWLQRLPVVLVCAGVLYYAILISHYTLITHVRMVTDTADLGEYDNQFFNSLHGHPFRLPASEGNLHDWSALKFHADFIIYFLLPFYALRPGPEILLILQTLFVAGTAIPIYLFGARRIPRWIAAIVALSFLLLPVIERPNFYDFHAVPMGMFFVAWAIWGVDRILHFGANRKRDYALFWIAFVLALASREDIAFGMVIVSVFLLFYGKSPRLSLTMLGLSLGYFVLIKFVIMPRVGVSWYDNVYDDIKASGAERYRAVVLTLLTNPVFVLKSMVKEPKVLFVLHMTAPLLFLWVRRAYLWAAILPTVFFTLMVTNRAPMFQSSFQYAYQWFPYIVIASILALQHIGSSPSLGRIRQTSAALCLGLCAAGAGFQYGILLGGKSIIGGFGEKRIVIGQGELERYRDLHSLVAQIPPNASVTATKHEGPHVSTRLILYNLSYALGDHPDYILFQRGLSRAEAQRVLPVLESGEYGLLDERGIFVLLRRGQDTSNNEKIIKLLKVR